MEIPTPEKCNSCNRRKSRFAKFICRQFVYLDMSTNILASAGLGQDISWQNNCYDTQEHALNNDIRKEEE